MRLRPWLAGMPASNRKGDFAPPLAAAGILLLALALQVPAFAAETGSTQAAAAAKAVVAKVNGQPIYEEQIAPEVNKDLSRHRNFGVSNPSEEYIHSVKARVLEDFIAAELLYQQGQKLDIPDLEQRVALQSEALKNSHRPGIAGKSEDEIRSLVRRQVLITEYMNRNDLIDPQIPESKIREYYETNKTNFMANETVNVRHILIAAAADETPEARQEALEKARMARKQVLDGKPFEDVAREISACNSAPGGGNLGYLERGFMPKEFDEVAFKMAPGVVSEPVATQYGYHVLEVLDHIQAGIRPYEELVEFIGKFLKQELVRESLPAHLQKLRQQAQVEVFLN